MPAPLDLLVEFLEVGAVLAFAQFLLDGLDLLVQVVLALALLHLALDAATDALFHLQDVDFGSSWSSRRCPGADSGRQVQHFLLGFELERQVGGDGVGQAAGIIDAGDGGQNLWRDLLVEFDVLVELVHHGAAQGFDSRLVSLTPSLLPRAGRRR